jgi:hypothetical protein
MGQDVAARVFSRADRQRYREKVWVCLDVFARMLAESRFEPARGSFGLEIELNLTGDNETPAMANAAVLEAIADPDFQTELYNDHGDVAEFISLLDPEVELQTPGGPRLRGHDQARDWFDHRQHLGRPTRRRCRAHSRAPASGRDREPRAINHARRSADSPRSPRLREPQPRASGSVTMTPGQNGACVRFRRVASPTQVRRKS